MGETDPRVECDRDDTGVREYQLQSIPSRCTFERDCTQGGQRVQEGFQGGRDVDFVREGDMPASASGSTV